ncbi:ankyrin repeat-containing protein [Plakobranchus ocellatus]|uniref:Ankyrin repeat-containing protein n=1 Tax=Plakobranchus ocellatus TaxID=259542 RepID=A0AAV4ATZ9_9GAST|nr:ankyrin repeat-containing protein [Plakobranchus ocellatus]
MSQPTFDNAPPIRSFPSSETQKIPPPPSQPLPPPLIYIHETARSGNMIGNSATIFNLTQAIEEDSLHKMKSLIEKKGVDVNSTLSYGVCILLKAIRSRSIKVVDYLITMGADPESSVRDMMRGPDGLEAEYARCNRHDKWSVDTIMRLLPQLGERIHDIVDNQGRTLLYLSCYFPDLSIFEYLVKAGLDPNTTDNQGSSVLSLLITHSDYRAAVDMVQLVLRLPNIQVNIPNQFGSTPLFQSFLANKLEIFYLLLEKGADPFVKTFAGNTLMHCPFLHSHKYLILHDLGLGVNAKNRAGLKPLQNKMDLDFDFFILILLGREVLDEEYTKMESSFKPATVREIKERVDKGEFSAMRLKSLCRRKIRSHLFQLCPQTVVDSIWLLPLPRPLQLYLDVLSYAKYLLSALDR